MDFELLDDDVGFLNSTFNDKWQTIPSTVAQGIVIENYSLPSGYNPSEIKMMILVPQNYPMAQLDMFYTSPSIAKNNGNPIQALNNVQHFGMQWQGWSRHYTWQEGIHNIATHFQAIKNFLEEELQR